MVSFERQWARWHDEHEQRRAAPHGFLAITGLHWLTGTPQRFPGVPGEWHAEPDAIVAVLDSGERRFPAGRDATLRHGAVEVEVAWRGGHGVLRPRDPQHPTRLRYLGTPAYTPDEKWVIAGRFVPFGEPRPITVGSVVEGLEHVYESPGRIEFTVGGQELALTAFNGGTPGSLSVLFTDGTSGITTYPANRSLSVAAPEPDGSVVLDFNRATNLPCAYTEFATCPLPPPENRLPVPVEAGEQLPR